MQQLQHERERRNRQRRADRILKKEISESEFVALRFLYNQDSNETSSKTAILKRTEKKAKRKRNKKKRIKKRLREKASKNSAFALSEILTFKISFARYGKGRYSNRLE